jgi:metabolite-proton symporter
LELDARCAFLTGPSSTTPEASVAIQTDERAGVRPGRVALASFIGTAIEWYDFFLFGAAATLVFNRQFFPTLSPAAGTLAALATFGAAFAARPVGGIVFGHFGDRIGRKRMLVLSLVLMGASTVAIGLLPTYEQAGMLAPLLLVLARLVQGFAVGGEWGGAVLMAVEHAPPGRRAFYGSFPQAGVPAGLVLSSAAFLAVQQLPEEQLLSWGWRVPFLASVVLVLVGLYVRMQIVESPAFRQVRESGAVARFPLGEALRNAPRPLLVGMATQAAANVPFYVVSVFVLSYGPSAVGVSREIILLCLLVACLLDLATVPLAAVLADRIGRRRMLMIGAAYMAAVAFPFFWLFDTGEPWAVLAAMILVVTIGHAVTYAAIAGFLAEIFEARLRYTGASVAYQVGGMITSGPAPFVAVALITAFGGSWVIALYIVVACAVTLVGLRCAPAGAR